MKCSYLPPNEEVFLSRVNWIFPDSKSLMQFCLPSFRRVVVSCIDADIKCCKDDNGCSGREVPYREIQYSFPVWTTRCFVPLAENQQFSGRESGISREDFVKFLMKIWCPLTVAVILLADL